MSSALEFIVDWYRAQCNGSWEHANGITIETLDSPGWIVTIDLVETALEDRPMQAVRRERSVKDWIDCTVERNKFHGQGDSTKLSEILEIFRKWAGSERGSKPAAEKSAAGKPSDIFRR